MKTQDAIHHFGTQSALKKALNLKARQTIHAWGEFPPIGRQYQIEVLTEGRLKAERNQEAVDEVYPSANKKQSGKASSSVGHS